MADTIIDGGGPFADYTSDSIGYQPSTRTAQQVITHVQRTFGDESGVQLVSTDIIRWINDAQDTIVNRARPLKARAFTNSIAGIADYKLPGDNIIQVESLHYDGQLLENTPFAQAERGYVGSTKTGAPETWWEWSGTFTLYPAPTEPKQITLYYTMTATRVVNPADVLGVPDKYYQTLLSYVMQQAYELDENFAASEAKRNAFSQDLDGFDEEERIAQHMVYESITRVETDGGW